MQSMSQCKTESNKNPFNFSYEKVLRIYALDTDKQID